VRAAFEDARSALKRAQSLGVKDVSIRIGLARCLAADGRTDDQIAELRAAAKDFPGDPAAPRALAFALYHAGRHAEAIEAFRPLSDAAPGDMNLTLTLAASARAAKDEALALAMADRALEKHADDRRSWECLWAVYSADKRWGELADKLEGAAKARPGNALGAWYAAFAAASAQRWDDALGRLDEVWKLDPRNAAARLEAGRIRFQHKKDRDGASQAARDVLEAEPDNRKAGDLLSFVAMRRSDEGDHAGAARELAVLASKRPGDPIVHANLGLELRWAGRSREAEESYRRAIELAPEDAQTRNDLGLLYLVLGRDAEARESFLAGATANPEANDCLENLGWMARRDGRRDEALSWFRKAYDAALRRGQDGARHRRHLDDLRYPLPPLGAPR
jgi:tetratricopeptide (TPR) repeat protein